MFSDTKRLVMFRIQEPVNFLKKACPLFLGASTWWHRGWPPAIREWAQIATSAALSHPHRPIDNRARALVARARLSN